MEKLKQPKGRKGQKGSSKHDISFRRFVAKTYIEGDQSLNQLAKRFGIPNQTISNWVLRFSSELAQKDDINIPLMTEQEQKDVEVLQKEVEALRKKLQYEQMRNFALETLADLAKTELGID